jgi:hypothetical protein
LETYPLVCHPDTPACAVESVKVFSKLTGNELWLRYYAACELNALVIPNPEEPDRCDGLWQSTCFEAFIEDVGKGCEGYAEFNFAPSSQWAAYHFDSYRENMTALEMAVVPEILLDVSESHFALEVTVPVSGSGEGLAISAVIVETDGTKSYWALAHPPGKPDFHASACFAATLPPPEPV